MQAWASRTHPGARVYRLYALSNLASLAALVTYPTLVERLLPLRLQAWLWSATYAAFALTSLLCLRRLPPLPREREGVRARPARTNESGLGTRDSGLEKRSILSS